MASQRRRRFAIIAVLSLVLLIAGFPPLAANADELGPPVLSGSEATPRVGGAQTPLTELYCPPNAVLTEVPVGFKATDYVGSAGATCSEVREDGGEAVVSAVRERVPAGLGSAVTGGEGESGCPTDGVVVGFRAANRFGGFVDSMQVLCRELRPDGQLAENLIAGPAVGKPGYYPLPDIVCPGEMVATGVIGAYNTDLTEEDLYSFGLRCRTLGFPSTTPADINLAWPTALTVGANSSTPGRITQPGQDRWYRFPVQPGSRVQVQLTGLTADADVTLFRDIDQAFSTLTTTADLTKLSAEFAGDAFAPSVFSPSVFSPSVFSPSVFSPSVFSPSVFSPSVFSPSVFSPSVFSPSVFSPSVFSPSVFSPSVFSPAVDAPSVFSPSVFSPSVFSPSVFSEAFSSAQTRSVIGLSSRDGTADESISTATYNNTGFYYVRVQGRNGGSPADFTLGVSTTGGVCNGNLDLHTSDSTLTGTPGAAQTVILTDPSRLPGSAADKATLAGQLATFAGRVNGVVVDLGQSAKVRALNAQADNPDNISCPYAKNLVAEAARDVVNSYRDGSGTLKYVVVIGADAVVPFFRYADNSGLGPESNYVPPVADRTASEASLRGNYVLGQDAYGTTSDLVIKGTEFPVPDLAVGRLVESPADISATLQRFLTRNGAPLQPSSTLATGYDFLTDAADAVARDFAAGVPSGRNDTLITDADVPPSTTTQNGTPSRRASWTATDLRTRLLGSRHDLVFLAGHFSANNTLAADYDTTVNSDEVAGAPDAIFQDSLVFSAGCHSGYTIVDSDGIPDVTAGLDWTQAFARKGATLIAGTGYQYGDTDFTDYSERLYANFARQLRYGSGAVPVGRALVAAKQEYLRTTASLGGIDQKALLISTLYGLPMLGVDLPGGRLPAPNDSSVATPSPVSQQPGQTLGLQVDDLELNPTLQTNTKALTNLDGGSRTATYLSGSEGVSTSPAEPALPLVSRNVTVPGQVLRGVALRSASYTDEDGITPLTGAPATETHSVHGPFVTPAFYPAKIATVNYFDALGAAGSSGTTRLMVTPAQHRSDAAGSLTNTLRRYSALGLRLFYSSNIAKYGPNENQPAQAAAPNITDVQTTIDGNAVVVSARVVGDPSAGIQSVFATYTGEPTSPFHGQWRSLDLTQNATDSTLWSGRLTLPAGQDAEDVRLLIQAVNGVGLVGIDDNQGSYFTPGVPVGDEGGDLDPTQLVLGSSVPTTGAYGTTVRVSATLTGPGGTGLPQRPVTFAIGGATRTAFTNSSGVATTDLPLTVPPGSYAVVASYDGDETTSASAGPPKSFTVAKQDTTLTATLTGSVVTAKLVDAGGLPLREKSVYFAFRNAAGAVLDGQTVITDRLGTADLSVTNPPPGTSQVSVWFGTANTPVPNGTVDLSDPNYRAAGPVSVPVSSTPTVVAKPDSYSTPGDSTLTVAKPGVLANDTAGTTATLVSGPASGKLTLKPDGSFSYVPAVDFVGTVTFSYRAVLGTTNSAPATVSITVAEPTPKNCTIKGTPGNDTLKGTAKNDVICGLGGNDTITGGDGNDLIYGGSGDDSINGGTGLDVIDGAGGDDVLSGGAGIDVLSGGTGKDTLNGDAGNDALVGGEGDDVLNGGDDEDALTGGTGKDKLNGGNANDLLDAKDGAGGDEVDGGAGTKDVATKDAGDTVVRVP